MCDCELTAFPSRTSSSESNHNNTQEHPVTQRDEEKYEKPWERVSSWTLLLVFAAYMLLAYLTQWVEDEMPTPVRDLDIAGNVSDKFSEEAALRYLHEIIGDQPRVAGTKYHLRKTEDLKKLLDSIAAQAMLTVHTDWQFATGDYWLDFYMGHANRYVHVSNVVAVLEGESGFRGNGSIGTSLLLNCHYDSVPFALGASDNALFCAIMVETLSRLSRRRAKLKHNVIFLFNGAEENPLQGSHGFLQHEWSRNCVGVINMDASGMNGKANVFQVTDIRLLQSYQRTVRRPSLQGFGEFLFSTGIIPSDTDFRIWRDFGKIYGIDMAFVKWGSVYHTRYDVPALLRPGVPQAAGDMLLALTADIADMEQLAQKSEPTSAVYYDYLNLFTVVYGKATAAAVDASVALSGLSTVGLYLWMVGCNKPKLRELCLCAGFRIAGYVGGAALAMIVTAIMALVSGQLKYLTQPWIVGVQVWLPYFVGYIGISHLYDSWRMKKVTLNRSLRVYQAQASTRLLLSITLLLLSSLPAAVSARYVLTVPLLMMSTASVVSMMLYRSRKMTAWQHLLLECTLSLPVTMFIFAITLRLNAVMMPTMGRTPTNNPDYTIAGLNIATALLMSCALSGVEVLFSRRRLWIVLSALLAACVAILCVPIFPYQDDGPSTQRHYWFHTHVRSFNFTNALTAEHNGILFSKYDKYTYDRILSALTAGGRAVNVKTDVAADCDRWLHCNLPLFRPRNEKSLRDSLVIYSGGPRWDSKPRLEVTSRRCVKENCTFAFKMTGAPHNLLTIYPRDNITVTSWSYATSLRHSFYRNNRPVYVIAHSEATYKEGPKIEEFVLHLVVPGSLRSGPVLDVVHHAHKIHHPEDFTEEYRNILDAMPKYFNIATYITMRTNYEF